VLVASLGAAMIGAVSVLASRRSATPAEATTRPEE
jgi:hypothetical protein